MLAALGALTLAVQGDYVIFNDTFNSTPSLDINTNRVARQAGGLLSADYTGVQSWYGVDGTRLVQTGGGEIVQPANLAAYVAGGNFTLSFKQDLDLTSGVWSSVYLASATENTRGNSRVGFHTWGTGNGTAFTLYSGTGTNGAAYAPINITGAQMDTLWQSNFTNNFDRLAEHTIQFVSTAGAGGTNTYDFVVDNVIVANDVVYAFRDDTVRNIEMVSTLLNDAADAYQVFYDDLTVTSPIPEPATLGMLGSGAALILLFRRCMKR
jgi:hypothetical protein